MFKTITHPQGFHTSSPTQPTPAQPTDYWLGIALTLLVGLSIGLTLLFMRLHNQVLAERKHLARGTKPNKTLQRLSELEAVLNEHQQRFYENHLTLDTELSKLAQEISKLETIWKEHLLSASRVREETSE